jgi:large subunit ribosomal protein L23
MAIFGNKKTSASAAKVAGAKDVTKKKKVVATTEETPAAVTAAPTTDDKKKVELHPLIANPRVSEKAAILTSKGTYVFNVPTSANKIEVRKAVEKQYKVNVVRVNMLRGEGKMVRRGRATGQRTDWKKALVTLKAGQKIEIHSGV